MNIIFVSAYDAPKGQSARTYNFARELVELGHNVTFITNGFNHFSREEYLQKDEKYRLENIDGINILWLRTFPYYSNGVPRFINMLSNAWQAYFKSNLIENSPDIVIGPSVPLFTGLSAYFISKKRKAKFVFEIRDVWPQALIDLGYLKKSSLLFYIFRKIEVFLYEKSAHIVSVLPYVYKHISKSGISRSKISYIPNGVYLKDFSECYGDQNSPGKFLSIKYIGNFSATHGTSIILECAKRLRDYPVNFILIGASISTIHELSKTIDSYKNIKIMPVIPRDRVASELISSDILIASVKDTKVYQFGINSNKIYDYMAAGKPIIFSGNTPNNQILEANAGIVVPPDDLDALCDAVVTMINMSTAERVKIGMRGRAYAEKKLDVKVLSKKLDELFKKII